MVVLGFSGGAAFAGGLLLDDPQRWTGTAVLYGTLPFDAGVPTTEGRLVGASVLVAHGETDTTIPADLLDCTWTYLHDASVPSLEEMLTPPPQAAQKPARGHRFGTALPRPDRLALLTFLRSL